jgi:NADH:ubiquinone oxidoreductase subunit C
MSTDSTASAPSTDAEARVAAALEGVDHTESPTLDGVPTVEVPREALHAALAALRDRAGFDQMTFVTAVDHYPAAPRFELLHQLRSFSKGGRVRVRTWLAEDDAAAPTCVDLFPGAAFMERECFDMFGIHFDGHAGLRRLLMPEGYDHHPLRKDFPQQGIEPDRLYREWDRGRRTGGEA